MAFAKGAAGARVQAVKTFRPAAFLQVGPGWARFSPERVGNTLMPGRRAMKSAYFIRSYAVFHEIRPDSELHHARRRASSCDAQWRRSLSCLRGASVD
jgi:hypothetical protein